MHDDGDPSNFQTIKFLRVAPPGSDSVGGLGCACESFRLELAENEVVPPSESHFLPLFPTFTRIMSLSAALRTPRTATLAARSSRSLARSYATTADFSVANAHGIKVASEQNPASTGSISLVVNAGSRYSGAGLAHVLRDSVFKVSGARFRVFLT